MAKSEILRLQDKDGDNLIDVCKDLAVVAETFQCAPCIKNPYASVPNWRELDIDSPFFNERECKYQVAVVTPHTTTMEEGLLDPKTVVTLTEEEATEGTNAYFEEFAIAAVESLLVNNVKDDSEPSRAALLESLEYDEFYLDPRPNSRLTLLYSVPYTDLQAIPADDDTSSDDDDDDDDEDDKGSTIEVTYKASDIKPKIIRIRKALRLYTQYLYAFRALDGGNILTTNNAVFNLQRYGDSGKFGKSTLGSIAVEIDSFLSSRGLNIVGLGGGHIFQESVTNIDFKFNSKFKLVQMKVYTSGCADYPKIYGKKKLKSLNKKQALKDQTAMSYFSKLDAMDTELQSREPPDWKEFIVKHTFPEVYHTFAANQPQPNARSCIADALTKEGKQLGQNIIDSSFSIGDALVKKFRKNMCLNEVEELEEEDLDLGLQVTPDVDRADKTILEMATEQAFATMEDEDQVFASLCAGILNATGLTKGFSSFSLEDIWKEGLDNIKLCGLFDLLLEAATCLMQGLTFEEAAASMVKAALKGMSQENLIDFFTSALPPDAARQIESMAQAKLESGDVFPAGTNAQRISDAATSSTGLPPSPVADTDANREDAANEPVVEGNQSTPAPDRETSTTEAPTSQKTRRTLAQQFDVSTSGTSESLNKNVLITAYIQALVDYYKGNMIDALNMLNRYPGAQLIARTIAFLDCPQDPIINPSIPDFMKSLKFPECGTPWNVVAPKFQNPWGWIPEIKDFAKIFFSLLRVAMRELLLKIIIQLIMKICKLLGGAMCKGLAAVGSMAINAVAGDGSGYGGRESFKNVIRDSICGEDADMNQINDTVNDLFEKLGIDPAALTNQERVDAFVGDISSSTTQSELMSALLGEPTPEFLLIIDYLIEYEYPEFRGNVSNQDALADLFENIGNIMPIDLRDAMADELAAAPDGIPYPANPSLCATEEDLEDFCNRRAALLSGRATATQAALMCESDRDRLKEELDDVNDLIQSGIPNALQLPPVVSDPGCENGLIPFESEDAIAASIESTKNELKRIKIAYATDMLGNGPGKSRWGMMNMIMSDTMGYPLTTHHRKNFFQNRYVDFYVENDEDNDGRMPMMIRQRGAYPTKIASWLQHQLGNTFVDEGWADSSDLFESLEFSSSNEIGAKEVFHGSFEALGLQGGLYDKPEIKLYELPDPGVNVSTSVLWDEQKVKFVRAARKANPDLKFVFKDNAKGLRFGKNSSDSSYSYGFDMNIFFSNVRKTTDGVVINSSKDNVRILTELKFNPGAKTVSPMAASIVDEDSKASRGDDGDDGKVITERYDEIYYIDNTLSDIDENKYPSFMNCFKIEQSYMPQVVLLKEMFSNEGVDLDSDTVKTFYDSVMDTFTRDVFSIIANNDMAFNYGAKFDDLTEDDVEYVLGPGYRDSGMLYGEAEIEGEDEDGNKEYRKIKPDDMIMGMSRMQYQIENEGRDSNNRVFYLNPQQFGGTYMNPPVYISPLENEGWTGLIDVLFPEITHCKDKAKTDLVNFSEIEEMIQSRLPTIPYDERLKAGRDACIEELAYNKLLGRDSTASIEGLIVATIRIFITSHIIKSLATFTKFKIDFPNVFSGLYAAYIVEDMERFLSGADDDSEERLSIFKDSEFWYAFLEQAVQTYGRNVDSGVIQDPPAHIISVMQALNTEQETWHYPDRINLQQAKDNGEVKRTKLLKNWREEKKFNLIYRTRNSAKKVLSQMVMDEFNKMAPTLQKNLETIGTKTEIDDLAGYLFSNYTEDCTIDLSDENLIETSEELPAEAGLEDQYTGGEEFSVYQVDDEESGYSKGDVYVGYYHTHADEDGNLLYMAGEVHSDQPHNLLKPFSTKMIVPIGDCANYGTSPSSTGLPFYLEKYTKIDDTRYTPTRAVDIILENDKSLNISDIYPGTMEVLYDPDDNPVGLQGELGVRHGLRFSVIVDGEPLEITSVEVDALDTTIGSFAPLESNSKLLLCLVNLLKEDETFNLLYRYIFPLNKLVSLAAIYNGMGFLASIGEITVADGSSYGAGASEIEDKPGVRASFETTDDQLTVETDGTDGWVSIADRTPGRLGGLFVNEYDSWDQQVLKRTKKVVKRKFRRHYNFVDFKPGEFPEMPRLGSIFLNNLRTRMKPPAGAELLPWWKRAKFRNNPFDSNGEICEKE